VDPIYASVSQSRSWGHDRLLARVANGRIRAACTGSATRCSKLEVLATDAATGSGSGSFSDGARLGKGKICRLEYISLHRMSVTSVGHCLSGRVEVRTTHAATHEVRSTGCEAARTSPQARRAYYCLLASRCMVPGAHGAARQPLRFYCDPSLPAAILVAIAPLAVPTVVAIVSLVTVASVVAVATRVAVAVVSIT
jgi:hypothetical protein